MKTICLTVALFAAALTAKVAAEADKPQPAALEDVNVPFMARGYCYAGSKVVDKQAPGGFGSSNNLPKPIPANWRVKSGAVYLAAQPDTATTFGGKYKGTQLLLINATNQTVAFAAQDSRLSIVQEALDTDGKWKPIEYLPSSWCGNSYHRVFLEPSHYWAFAAPRYVGEFKTRLRFAMTRRNEAPIYSNEFEGSVNPGQFTKKQGHTPTDIMDPYLD